MAAGNGTESEDSFWATQKMSWISYYVITNTTKLWQKLKKPPIQLLKPKDQNRGRTRRGRGAIAMAVAT